MRSTMQHEYKQAFLIIAHKDDLCFYTLLQMLDKPWNDIYIHMDKKNTSYEASIDMALIKHAKVYHINRRNVTWGGYSLVDVELRLLEAATNNHAYDYYHLLSGQDLPIQSQETIRDFFIENRGKEFVRFENETFNYTDRVCLYHFFQDKIGREKSPLQRIELYLIKIQKLLSIRRNNSTEFQKGDEWFSISDDLARFIISKKNWIKSVFKFSKCADEIFMHTIITNSKFNDRLFHQQYDDENISFMRLIDWTRGNPYVFKESDYEELKSSKMMFARKFDSNSDSKIIQRIFKEYSLDCSAIDLGKRNE